ncbi:MAG TPA: FtsX-like permease family protein [Puia sp.]|nr:FtsX-like permease family protein [Puia sp.]
MFRNYLKIAWRSLLRYRSFSIINLVGLSISIAFCLLLFYHIRYEQSFDGFHQKKDRLYRCEMSNIYNTPSDEVKKSFLSFMTRREDEKNSDEFPLVVGQDMKAVFPEILSFTRWLDDEEQFIRADGQLYKQNRMVYADSNFFRNFSFPVRKGDPAKALAEPGRVVLTESTARKYFGSSDPIGRTIEIVSDSNKLLSVAAVVADAPGNSSIQFSMVLPLAAHWAYVRDIQDRFNHSEHYLVVELKPGTNPAAFESKMNGWMRGYYFPTLEGYQKREPNLDLSHYRWSIRPLAECHNNVSDWGHFTDVKSVYQLACIVIVILLLASLNYVLITVSNAAARSQEIGVRKVMGAGRWNVIWQSWMETQLIVGIATVVGLVLAWAGIPLLRLAIGSGVTTADISFRESLLGGAAIAFVLSLLAGYYPALLISRLKPVSILKSFQTFRINPRFSRVLVICQFTCCVGLLMAAFVIDRQMEYVAHKDLGFDKDQVLIVDNPSYDRAFGLRLKERMFAFASGQPGVLKYSGMNGRLTGPHSNNGFFLDGQQYWMRTFGIDYQCMDLLGLKLLQGRSFSPQIPTDTIREKRAVVVNETLWKILGNRAKLGFYCEPIHSTIIGVARDFHYESLSKKIEPAALGLANGWIGEFLLKVKAGKTAEVLAALRSNWGSMAEQYPLEYSFLDASIAKMYEPEIHWQQAVRVSGFFAILIACLGLFGLSAINAVNRTREIGIRKVLGADLRDLLGTLTKGYVRTVVIAVLIGAPLSWWLMNKWLNDFAYRIELRWWMPVVVGMAALALALGTVSFQVWRVARTNPVDSLRSE